MHKRNKFFIGRVYAPDGFDETGFANLQAATDVGLGKFSLSITFYLTFSQKNKLFKLHANNKFICHAVKTTPNKQMV